MNGMKHIKAPAFVSDKVATVFLAGSIEMGAAENWQDRAVSMLADTGWTILNPRRDDWDNSWKQSLEDPRFVEQVEWELQGLETCEMAIVYFDPTTKAPITLLELGLLSQIDPHKALVVCPEGFYRKGNVDVVCSRYGIKQYPDLEHAVAYIKTQQFTAPEF
jgi:hypothetical protein